MPDTKLDALDRMWEVFDRLPEDMKAELVDGEIHVMSPSGGKPGRGSFSPDVSFHVGPEPTMKYVEGPPVFAVEVRGEGDYGPRMDAKLARKRDDYFAAGTRVVWDVDLLGGDTVRVYRADAPDAPAVFRRGETADAEPAVPGWRFPVDDLFP